MIKEGFLKQAKRRGTYLLIKGLADKGKGLLYRTKNMPQLFSAKPSAMSRYQKKRYNGLKQEK